MYRMVMLIPIFLLVSTLRSQAQSNAGEEGEYPGIPMHYELTGQASGVSVLINLDAFVCGRNWRDLTEIDRQGEPNKQALDIIWRESQANPKLHSLMLKLHNDTKSTIELNAIGDRLVIAAGDSQTILDLYPYGEAIDYPPVVLHGVTTSFHAFFKSPKDRGDFFTFLAGYSFEMQRWCEHNNYSRQQLDASLKEKDFSQGAFGEYYISSLDITVPLHLLLTTADDWPN